MISNLIVHVNVNKALANLNYVIHDERIYRDSTLSLSSLAID